MNLPNFATLKDLAHSATEIPVKKDTAFVDALEFKENAEPSPGVSYEWVYEYAVGAYERTSKTFDKLDDKASDIIKYLGGGTGLFTIAALASMRPENASLVFWTLPSFASAIVSIYYAAMARKPNETITNKKDL